MKYEVYVSNGMKNEDRNSLMSFSSYNYETDDMYNRYYFDDDENYEEIEAWHPVGTYDDSIGQFID